MKKRMYFSAAALLCAGMLAAGCSGNASKEAESEAVEEETEVTENAEAETAESAEAETETEVTESTESETEEESAEVPESFEPGATVFKSEDSPTGYMVHFVYETDEEIEKVSVTGPFLYIDPSKDIKDESNCYTPYDYQNGFYASNCAPGPFTWGYTEEMTKNEETGAYESEFPISSGSFAYGYVVVKADGTEETIDDPANPSPAKDNPNSDIETGDLVHSIVYGHYDEEKQSESPNLDFVLPAEGEKGTFSYVEYTGHRAETEDLGVYLPAGYDAEREEPYKVLYLSHGGGGNETDWFAMGHADNIVDNLGLDVIVVSMDNASYEWDFEAIEDNVLNYIIPYMEANYNVSTEAADRAFAGLSMGCMTTFHMYYDYPTEFAYFGGFSGPDLSAIKDTEGLENTLLYFTVGTCDIASNKVMENEEGKQIKYEDYVEYLKTATKENVIDGGYVYGSHDWFTWSKSLHTFLSEIAFVK